MADGPARKPRRRSHAFSTTLLVLAVLTTIAAGAFLYGASRYVDRLPTLDAIKAREIGANSSVFDARGNSLGVLANEERTLARLAPADNGRGSGNKHGSGRLTGRVLRPT